MERLEYLAGWVIVLALVGAAAFAFFHAAKTEAQVYQAGYVNPFDTHLGIDPDTIGKVNSLGSSEDFTAADWGGAKAPYDYITGQPDPFGGSNATLVVNSATPVAYGQLLNQFQTVDSDLLVGSVWVKWYNVPAGYATELRLYCADTDSVEVGNQSLMIESKLLWIDTSGGFIYLDGTNDGGGYFEWQNGWVRLWVAVDLKSRGIVGTDWRFQINVQQGNDPTGDGNYFFGAQMEPGRARPGPYLKTP